MAQQVIEFSDGPFIGMIDSPHPASRRAGYYQNALNMRLQDPVTNQSIFGRPGWGLLDDLALLGAVAPVVWFGEVSTVAGNRLAIAILGNGDIYRLNLGVLVAATWQKYLTLATDIPAACANYYTDNMVSALSTPWGIVVSGGACIPFLWDGAITGVVTALVNAPIFYGPPTVYAGRLMGITVAERHTIKWSQADDPTTGYTAGGFTNAWKLTQTKSGILHAIRGTNDGVIVWRASSTTLLTGDPATDFQGANTEDSLDQTQGTIFPFAIAEVNDNWYFLNQYAQLQLLQAGSTRAVPCWHGFANSLALDNALPGVLRLVHDKNEQRLLAPYLGASPGYFVGYGTLVWDLHGEVAVPMSIWTLTGKIAFVTYRNDLSGLQPIYGLAMVGPQTSTPGSATVAGKALAAYGYSWNVATLQFGYGFDDFANPTPIQKLVVLHPLGASDKREKLFDRLDISSDRNAEVLTVQVNTPRGNGAVQTTALTSLLGAESHAAVGLNDYGRWASIVLGGTFLSVHSVTLTAFVSSDDPGER